MKRLLRKIRALGILDSESYPDQSPLAFIEAVVELISGHDLPGQSAPDSHKKRAGIMSAISSLADWTKLDSTFLGYLYESLIESDCTESRSGMRRKRGIFYTPSFITEYLAEESLDGCLSTDEATLLKIIDPACGGGAFLISIFRKLRKRHPDIDPAELISGSIFGMDTDSDAVYVARLALWMESGCDIGIWDTLKSNVVCGDSLREFTRGGHDKFDVVVTNPPYRNVKRGITEDVSEFCRAHFKSARGQWDLAVPFVELALEHILKPGGVCGFILPNPILLAENYEPVREIILRNELVAFGPAGAPFDDPGVEAGLLVVRKSGRSKQAINNAGIVDGRDGSVYKNSKAIPTAILNRLPSRIFSHLAGDGEFIRTVLDMQDTGVLAPLGNFVRFTRGIECGKRDKRVFGFEDKIPPNSCPLIVGSAVGEYFAKPYNWFVLGEDDVEARVLKDKSMWGDEDILLLRRVADRPIAAVAQGNILALNTLYVIRGEPVDLYSACALINSDTFRKIFKILFAFDDRLFPYIRVSQISRVPVVPLLLNDAELSGWSWDLHELHKIEVKKRNAEKIRVLKGKIDYRVREVYFPMRNPARIPLPLHPQSRRP